MDWDGVKQFVVSAFMISAAGTAAVAIFSIFFGGLASMIYFFLKGIGAI